MTKAYALVGRTTGRSRSVTKRSVAKKAATSKPSRTAARKKSPSAAIRAWANANGVPVGLKGVVRQEVVDAYNAARKKK